MVAETDINKIVNDAEARTELRTRLDMFMDRTNDDLEKQTLRSDQIIIDANILKEDIIVMKGQQNLHSKRIDDHKEETMEKLAQVKASVESSIVSQELGFKELSSLLSKNHNLHKLDLEAKISPLKSDRDKAVGAVKALIMLGMGAGAAGALSWLSRGGA
tara:strand:+ start:31 stop:510 length:480 start_codon:yes stop_codon:yes gene_type:complete